MGEGQDWASYQGGHPSAAGLDFVGIKVTEGIGYVNPFWRTQLAIVRAAGAVPLLYHYPHFANSPVSEAAHFLAVLAGDIQPGDVLVLDYEGYDQANAGIPMARQIAYKATFLTELERREPTHQNGTYANLDYLNQDPHGPYGNFLWVATAGRAEGDPGISRPWLFHQYSERGGLDRDYTRLSRAELIAWAHQKDVTDMTPEQASQLAAVYNALPYIGWGYRNHAEDAAAQAASGGKNHSLDAWGKMSAVLTSQQQSTAQIGALTALVQHLAAGGGLTPEQITAAAEEGARAALAELGHDLTAQLPAGVIPAEEAAETPAQEAAEQPEPAGA